jgi:hypothetical protein
MQEILQMRLYSSELHYLDQCKSLSKIRDVIYNNILCSYFSKLHEQDDILWRDPVLIIESYVGHIYYPIKSIMTLGLRFVSNNEFKELDKMYSNNYSNLSRCSIHDCQLLTYGRPHSFITLTSPYSLCEEHYNQWYESFIKYVHIHDCVECYTNYVRIKKYYSSIIMKCNNVICHNVANIILSFMFGNQSVFTSTSYIQKRIKCQGHIVLRKYECHECIMMTVD